MWLIFAELYAITINGICISNRIDICNFNSLLLTADDCRHSRECCCISNAFCITGVVWHNYTRDRTVNIGHFTNSYAVRLNIYTVRYGGILLCAEPLPLLLIDSVCYCWRPKQYCRCRSDSFGRHEATKYCAYVRRYWWPFHCGYVSAFHQ